MPILEKGKTPPTNVVCVREVRAGAPVELVDELRRFYADTLGLVPWPERRQIPGGWGVGHPERGLYLQFRHDPEVDQVRRRFALTVPSLAGLEERLLDHPWPYDRVRGFGWSDHHILLRDPAGHLIEVRQSQPL